jgi:hypothetical protein
MKALVCVLALAGGCEWAQRHPAPSAAITGGVIALGTCEIQGTSQATCGIISGSAAVLLGLTAAVVMWIVGDQPTEDQSVDPSLLVPDEAKPVHVPTKAEPPPNVDEPAATNPPTGSAPTTNPTTPSPTSPTPTSPAPTSPPAPGTPSPPSPSPTP